MPTFLWNLVLSIWLKKKNVNILMVYKFFVPISTNLYIICNVHFSHGSIAIIVCTFIITNSFLEGIFVSINNYWTFSAFCKEENLFWTLSGLWKQKLSLIYLDKEGQSEMWGMKMETAGGSDLTPVMYSLMGPEPEPASNTSCYSQHSYSWLMIHKATECPNKWDNILV